MYDGIGLPTPRGSGTSGYIQRNLGFLKPRRDFRAEENALESQESSAPKWKKSEELLEHKRKRDIENKVLVFRESLSESLGKEEIDRKCDIERRRLLALDASLSKAASQSTFGKEGKDPSKLDSHQVAELKSRQTEAFRSALRVSADDSTRGWRTDKAAKQQPPAVAGAGPPRDAPPSKRRRREER